MKRFDPLTLLARPDKWYLGGGGRLLWAPPFPSFLDRPGFWDKGHYYNFEIHPLFTWTVLDERGHEIPLDRGERRWNPAVLLQRFSARRDKLAIEEEKAVLPHDVAVSQISIANLSGKVRRLHLVVWTAHDTQPSKRTAWVTEAHYREGRIGFEKHVAHPDRPEFRCSIVLGSSRRTDSFSINLSEGMVPPPEWSITPFSEQFAGEKLANAEKLHGVTDDGVLYMALHVRLTIRPRQKKSVTFGVAVASSVQEARQHLCVALESGNPISLSEMNWRGHFADAPFLQCSDEYFTRYYWYRWYGLKLNTIATGEQNYRDPFVCEGIGYFRAPISYSAPCHMLENRWLYTPSLPAAVCSRSLTTRGRMGAFVAILT